MHAAIVNNISNAWELFQQPIQRCIPQKAIGGILNGPSNPPHRAPHRQLKTREIYKICSDNFHKFPRLPIQETPRVLLCPQWPRRPTTMGLLRQWCFPAPSMPCRREGHVIEDDVVLLKPLPHQLLLARLTKVQRERRPNLVCGRSSCRRCRTP